MADRNKDTLSTAKQMIKEILQGTYRYNDGDERLEIGNNKYVKINFTSSGQQEVIWIMNLLFYCLLQGNPTSFIIEEPESQLFPEAQKTITDFIALVCNAGHEILLTTHSPYVLGSINNLLYASRITDMCVGESTATSSEIVSREFRLSGSKVSGWFINGGGMTDAIDHQIGLIQNELIDEISSVINRQFDEIAAVVDGYGG
jgi:hypothetical protein